KDERLAAGRRTRIENVFLVLDETLGDAGKLPNQLRPLVLHAHTAFTKGRRGGYIAGDHSARGAEQLTGCKLDSRLAQFVSNSGTLHAHVQSRLDLTVAADRLHRFRTI